MRFSGMKPLLLLAGVMLLAVNCGSAAQPESFIDTPALKFGSDGVNLYRYSGSSRHNMIKDGRPVYRCPAGFTLADFAVGNDGGSPVLGVLIAKGALRCLEICRENGGEILVARDMTPYQPWKIRFADADSDRRLEVCLGVYKESPLHPTPARRLFIYDFHQGLQPVWRGSRLARPLLDFEFLPFSKGARLFALEADARERPALNRYQWDSFGYSGLGSDPASLPAGVRLEKGYLRQNGRYRGAIFVLNRGKVLKAIQSDGEE